MSICLLDVNTLIALAWPNHVSHREARAWFSHHENGGWSTCPLTQSAFVRISSNPAIITEAVSPREALSLLQSMTGLATHTFWPDDFPLEAFPTEIAASLVGHRQVTDAYLLALAIVHKGRLATFDSGVRGLLPKASPHQRAIVVIS